MLGASQIDGQLDSQELLRELTLFQEVAVNLNGAQQAPEAMEVVEPPKDNGGAIALPPPPPPPQLPLPGGPLVRIVMDSERPSTSRGCKRSAPSCSFPIRDPKRNKTE